MSLPVEERLISLTDFMARGETDHADAFDRALSSVGVGPGRYVLQLPAARLTLSRTIFVPSGVRIVGQGPGRTVILFSPDWPARRTGVEAALIGNIRTAAFAMIGVEEDADYARFFQETGDYYISPVLGFSPDGDLSAGSDVLTVERAEDAARLKAGDWLQLMTGQSGWHPTRSELVEVADVRGRKISLTFPMLGGYDATLDGLGSFVSRFELTNDPPGGAPLRRYRQSGWRRVRPVAHAAIEQMSIVNLRHHKGYANLAYVMARAVNCAVEDVVCVAGGAWHMDSQSVRCGVRLDPSEDRANSGICWNGSNRIVAQIDANDSSVVVEEGVRDIEITGRARQTEAVVQVIAFCEKVRFKAFDITAARKYGLVVIKSASVTFSGTIRSAGASFWYAQNAFDKDYPIATRRERAAAEPFFRGDSIKVENTVLESTANPGYELLLRQPIVTSNIRFTQAGGGTRWENGLKP